MTEKEFNTSVVAPVQLSLATSKIAVDNATAKNVKEFAGFELAESIALTTILKDLGTLIPAMEEKDKAAFAEIESAEAGMEFDKLYIKVQLNNHRMLRDLSEEYLKEAPTENLDNEESTGKHLAILALTVFNEHVAITERIDRELTGGS
jgi:putative membrane protein